MAGAIQENIGLIIVPLFALISFAVLFVVIPVFASMSAVGASASAGLMSMSGTLASFSPVYGIGLAIGVLVMFFGLAAIIRVTTFMTALVRKIWHISVSSLMSSSVNKAIEF